jgi:outer membrane receptor protein involved in Fe transport
VVLPAMRTDDYVLVNPFASYRRKLLNRNWTLQLNVNNVLGLNSDQGNSYTWPRKTEPRQFITTLTVDL